MALFQPQFVFIDKYRLVFTANIEFSYWNFVVGRRNLV